MAGGFIPVRIQPEYCDLARHGPGDRIFDLPAYVMDPCFRIADGLHSRFHCFQRSNRPRLYFFPYRCCRQAARLPISPILVLSNSPGSDMPSNVSYRNNARVGSPSRNSVSAAAIMLPPFQTPHSTIAPGMLYRPMYLTASINEYIRSGLVMVRSCTFAYISRCKGSKSAGSRTGPPVFAISYPIFRTVRMNHFFMKAAICRAIYSLLTLSPCQQVDEFFQAQPMPGGERVGQISGKIVVEAEQRIGVFLHYLGQSASPLFDSLHRTG